MRRSQQCLALLRGRYRRVFETAQRQPPLVCMYFQQQDRSFPVYHGGLMLGVCGLIGAGVSSSQASCEERSQHNAAEAAETQDPPQETWCRPTWERCARYWMGFRNSAIGVDIGGTVGKFVVLQRGPSDTHVLSEEQFGFTGQRVTALETPCPAFSGTLHFCKWNTEVTDKAMYRCARSDARREDPSQATVFATGGGAYRFEEALRQSVGWKLSKVGEFDALVDGLRFIFNYMPASVYYLQPDGTPVSAGFCNECFHSGRFPVLVCNIGTGVSMIKIAADGAERIGGTSVGGSTFLGLVYHMTSARTFRDAMRLAQEGDPKEVDLVVRDIYGPAGGEVLGIPNDITASSFGKLARRHDGDPQPSEAAIAASVCILVTQAIALYACQLARRHACRDVIFTGGFLEGNEVAREKLSFFVRTEYKRCEGEGRAMFVRHAEYAGALGCLSRKLHADMNGDSTLQPSALHH